jgi:hypothetical protein
MSYSRRLVGVSLLLVGVLFGITIGGPVAAAPSTKVTWKVASLQAEQVLNLHDVVSTNSPGVKTWSKKGSCTLTPRKKPTELKMGVTGSCILKLKIAQSQSYSAKRTQRTITLTPSTTTTTGDALMCAAGGICAVGETGPGGGTVFYVASSQFTSTGSACDTACRYLEAAPTGWIKSPSYTGQNDCLPSADKFSLDPRCVWSSNASSWTQIWSSGKAIGTGYANTSAMITQGSTAGTAATVARAFQGGGKTDWFLPAKDELNALCKWAFKDTVNAICNGSYRFWQWPLTFAYRLYWSSSDHVPAMAWSQSFREGIPANEFKSSHKYVRPVRAF